MSSGAPHSLEKGDAESSRRSGQTWRMSGALFTILTLCISGTFHLPQARAAQSESALIKLPLSVPTKDQDELEDIWIFGLSPEDAERIEDLSLSEDEEDSHSPISRSELESRLEELRDDLWERNLKGKLRLPLRQMKAYVATHIGVRRLEPHEVAFNRDRAHTEMAFMSEGSEGIWAKHRMQLRTEFLEDFDFLINHSSPDSPKGSHGLDSLRLTPSLSRQIQIEIVKRHHLKQDAKDSFWKRTAQSGEMMFRSFPLFFRLPLSAKDRGDFLPGESFAIEKVTTVKLRAGPVMDLISGLTWGAGPLALGTYLQPHLQRTLIPGAYKFMVSPTVEGSLRLTVERFNHGSLGIGVVMGARSELGPLKHTQPIASAIKERFGYSARILDLSFELSEEYPQARAALISAYQGDLAPAQELAEKAFYENYQGVRFTEKVQIRQEGSETGIGFLRFYKRKRHSLTHEDRRAIGTHGDETPSLMEEKRWISERGSWSEKNWTRVSIVTDLMESNPEQSRSFLLEYRFRDQKGDRFEIERMLRVLKAISHPEGHEEIDRVLNELPDKIQKKSRFEGYFFMALDSDAVSALLRASPNELEWGFHRSWAHVMGDLLKRVTGIGNPPLWASLKDDARYRMVRGDALFEELLQRANAFLVRLREILLKEMEIQTASQQNSAILKLIDEDGFDPYLAATLVQLGSRDDMLASGWMRFKVNEKPFYLERSWIGLDYVDSVESYPHSF